MGGGVAVGHVEETAPRAVLDAFDHLGYLFDVFGRNLRHLIPLFRTGSRHPE